MGYNIGPTLSVGGEAAYTSAMKSIRESMTYVKAEANAITSAFDKNDNSTQALTAKSKALSNAFDVQKRAVDEAKDALARMESQGVSPTSTAYQRMSANLNNAQAELNKTSKEINALNDAAKAERVEKFSTTMQRVGDIAGKAVVVGLKAAATAMVAIGTAAAAASIAIWNIGKNAGKAADDLLTLSAQTGIGVGTLQELQYAARFVDVEVESLTKGLAKTTKATGEAVKSNQDYISIADGVSVAIRDANGQMKSSEQIFYDSVDALSGMTDETLREVAAQDLFGRSYQDLMPLIQAGSGALAMYGAEARKLGLVLSDEMVAKLGEFDDIMQRTQAQFEGIGKQIAVIFLPALQSVGTGISEFLSVISTALADGFQAEDIKSIGGFISEKLIDGLKQFNDYLPDLITMITTMLNELVNVIVPLLSDLLPLLLDGAFQLLDGLINAVLENIGPLSSMVVSLLTSFAKFLLENLPLVISAGMQILVAVVTGIADSLPELIPAIISAVLLIVQTLIDNAPMLIDAALMLMQALAQGLIDALPQLIEELPEIIKAMIDYWVNNLPKIIEMGIKMTIQLAEGLIAAIPELIKALPEIIMAIVNGLMEGIGAMVEIGKNMVLGIWEGIKSMASWLWDQVSGFVSGIVEGVKSTLGIQSPSKVFAEIGKNMAIGLGGGFTTAMRDVSRSINSSVPSSIDITGSGVASAHTTIAPVLNVYTHDSLSEYELLREQENFMRRLQWGLS